VAHARKQVETLPPPPGPARDADGVSYLEDASAPGLKFFRCEPHRATLSMKGCAGRWIEAQVASGEASERLTACRSCPIGAAHAGYAPVRYSPYFGTSICPRHGGGTTRMIGNRVCVSCYNRQREMKAGKNARGNKPVELLQNPLRALELRLEVDGTARRFRDRETSSSTETMVQVLRTTKGEIAFGFSGSDRQLRQGRLF
jgi:hypothetical protein